MRKRVITGGRASNLRKSFRPAARHPQRNDVSASYDGFVSQPRTVAVYAGRRKSLRRVLRCTRGKGPGLDVLNGGRSPGPPGKADISSVAAYRRGNVDGERLAEGLIGNRVGKI
jgi:hypothetical protein